MAPTTTTTRHRGPFLGSAVALLVGLAVLNPAPARAGLAAPDLVSPSGSAGATPTMTWTRVPGATNYEVRIATDAGFTTDLITRTTVNRRFVPTTVLESGTIWWQVRAQNADGAGPFATGSFTSLPTSAPTLITPVEADTLTPPLESALLSWGPVASASSYTLEVDGNTTPGLLQPAHLASSLGPGLHMWRVKAAFSGGAESAWSELRTFTVGELPAVELLTPDGATGESVLLRWSPTLGATAYDVQVAQDDAFTDPEVDETAVPRTSLDPGAIGAGTWFWRVRATGAPWSEVREFTIVWADAPQLTFPDDGGTVGRSPRFAWEPLGFADSYELVLVGEVDDPATDLDETEPVTCTTAHTSYTPTVAGEGGCWPSAPGTWHWQVNGISSATGLTSPASEDRTFEYSPDPVEILGPVDGATVSVPVFTWEPVAGAERYRITVEPLDTESGEAGFTRTVSGTSFVSTQVLFAGNSYRWSVRTLDDGADRVGALPEDLPEFTVTAPGAPTSATPEPLGPPDASVHPRFPLLTWEPIAGATSYQVLTSTGTQTAVPYPAWVRNNATNAAATITWSVVANTPSGPVPGGSRTFTIAPPTDVDDLRVQSGGPSCREELPDTCAVASTPTLRWDSVPDAGHYRVYLSRSPTFAPGNNLLPTPFANTESERFLLTEPLADTTPGETFYWQVVPCTTGSSCAALTPATRGFTKTSPTVITTSPVGAAEVEGPVSFRWEPVAGASRYRLQVAKDAAFTQVLVTAEPTVNAYAGGLYPVGPLFWRVAWIDSEGHASAYSPAASFTRTSAAPVTGPAFTWQPVLHAASYVVEVSRDGAPVLTAGTPQAAFVPTQVLAPAAYTWRVRAVDVGGNPGPWSGAALALVTPEAPALLDPANGAVVGADDSLFSWSPVSGAASYRFERQRVGNSTLTESTATAATEHAPVSHFADGGWSWRVVALDRSGAELGTSPWRTFVVDSDAPEVTSVKPAGKKVKRTATFRLRFSEPVTGVSAATVRLTKKGRTVKATLTLSPDGTQLTLDPHKKLKSGKRYVVRVAAGITDLHGLPLAASSWPVKVKAKK